MKTATKIWLIVAAGLLVFGIAIITVALAVNNWSFEGGNSMRLTENSYVISEKFENIDIKSDTADIVFLPSEDGECRVVCYEKENESHRVSVEEGCLAIRFDDTRKWYERISIFSYGNPKITVYLPQGEYGSLSIKESTGDVDIAKDFVFKSINITVSTGDVKCRASSDGDMNIRASTGNVTVEKIKAAKIDLHVTTGKITASDITCLGEMRIRVSTGKTYLTGVDCNSFYSNGNTGDINLTDVLVAAKMDIERTTGDVIFDGCDAGEICVKTDTGDVRGTLLTEKIFFAYSDTGKKDVPKTMTGGRCEINCDTGDIIIKIQK